MIRENLYVSQISGNIASLTNGILCKHVDQKYGYNENKSPALDAAERWSLYFLARDGSYVLSKKPVNQEHFSACVAISHYAGRCYQPMETERKSYTVIN